jgi:hypothetical protein
MNVSLFICKILLMLLYFFYEIEIPNGIRQFWFTIAICIDRSISNHLWSSKSGRKEQLNL